MGWFGIIIGLLALSYGALWWYGRNIHPISYGISFSSGYAASLYSDWKKMYQEMLQDLRPRFVRLSVDWNQIEITEGVYDFSSVDFMMDEAWGSGAKVLLAVGQKTPRWPECHTPGWVKEKTKEEYLTQLYKYVEATITRYKDHPALEYWQIENEPYISFEFGDCAHFQIEALDTELTMVKNLDSQHEVVITDSGELSTWYTAAHKGDLFGTTMYRIIRTPGGKIVTYGWFPMGLYRFRAMVWGVPFERFFVSELQAEPWVHTGGILGSPVEEQLQTMSNNQMRKNLEDARHSGASRAYVWGVEWWYWMKYTHNDSSFVDLAREYIADTSEGN